MDNKNDWELIRKIIRAKNTIGFNFLKTFPGCNTPDEVFCNYTSEECKKIVEDWEKQINIMDVVTVYSCSDKRRPNDGKFGIVVGILLDIYDGGKLTYHVLTKHHSVVKCQREYLEKKL